MLKKIEGIEICGILCCVPNNKISNMSSIKHVKLSSNKQAAKNRIVKTIGIESRFIANPNICTSDLVFKAARSILKKQGWVKDDIEILVFVSQTGDYSIPATSGILQNKLKLKKSTLVLDLNFGCSGYTHGLTIMSSLMKSLNLKKGLLAVGDVLSKLVHKDDNISNLMFGDGVSVTTIKNNGSNKKYLYCNYYSDGSGYNDIIVPSYSLAGKNKLDVDQLKKKKDIKGNFRSKVNIYLDGPNVFKFGINNIHPFLENIIKKFKNIKYCFLHQANKMIVNSIKDSLNQKR